MDVFPTWHRAQLEVDRHAREATPSPYVLRTTPRGCSRSPARASGSGCGTSAPTTTRTHPLLGGEQGGPVDQLRVVHDVFGHAALGLGFDLQAEFATWLQCRTLFSRAARPAAFCELVGAVTAYITTGTKPGL